MRILRLDLDAFGPFTDTTLDLSAGRYGLHLISGPNEAGKTSALRALRDLLYGIHPQTSDDFLHDYKSLRLGAALEHSDGSILEFVRRKRVKNPLCEADGVTPLAPAALERFLAGVDASTFLSRFGINHERLVQGGEEIRKGGGDLGEMLFSASSGIAGLRKIQQALNNQADEYFLMSGRGKKQRIPESLLLVREAQQRLRSHLVTTEEWSRHDQALRLAEAEGERLDGSLRGKQIESNRLKRILGALELLAERAQLLAERHGLRDVITLPADFADRRREVQGQLATALHQAERSRVKLGQLREQVEAIAVDDLVLDAADAIEALHERRGEYRKLLEDRPRNAGFQQDNEHAARNILQSLGRPRDLAEAGSLRLRVGEPHAIQQLALNAKELDTQRAEVREAILRHREHAAQLERERGELPATPDLDPLRAALKQATRLGDLDVRDQQARDQLAAFEDEFMAVLSRLPGWSGTAEELERLATPLPETIARHEARLQEIEARRRELQAERTREERAAADLEARLRTEGSQRDLPTEEDLKHSRHRRDDGWRLVRGAWLEGQADAESTDRFVADLAPGKTLAEAYELSVVRSDDLADRLRREASDVAQRAERLATLEAHRARLAQIARDDEEARAAWDRALEDWEEIVRAAGLAGYSPSELKPWLDQREKVLNTFGQLRARRAEAERLARQVREHRERLATCLRDLQPNLDLLADESLASRVDQAQDLIHRHEANTQRREALENSLTRERSDLAKAESRLGEIEARHAEWRVTWDERMERIGLDPGTTPEQADLFLEEIRKLHKHLDEARGFESRIRGMDRDAEQFCSDVAALVRQVAPPLAPLAPGDAVEQLKTQLRAAQQADQLRCSLRKQIEAEESSLSDTDAMLSQARLELDALCRDAGCPTADDLPAAEQRSARRLQVEADLSRCEKQILGLSAGLSVEAFVNEAAEFDPDSLDLSIQQLDQQIDQIQRARDEVHKSIGAERAELARIDGGSKASEANDQVGHELARLQADIPRYAALRIAAHVLHQGLDRYRLRNQAPVLNRASALFARLTGGSFLGLTIGENEKGEHVLVGVRPDGQTQVGVDAMSDGSCDQLYLALRIASLEIWLQAHEPIPLIVDDILLRFDNPRAVAALQVLAEFSRLTQVIFFTHHAHLVELAREHLSDDVLFTHELLARSHAEAGSPS